MKKGAVVDHKAVLAEDSTTLESLQGFLSKRSHFGSWQKRYFVVNNNYLNYFGSKKMLALKASCDLTEMTEEAQLVGRFGEFCMSFEDSVEVHLKAKNLVEAGNWIKCINERWTYYTVGAGSKVKEMEEERKERGSLTSSNRNLMPSPPLSSPDGSLDDCESIATESTMVEESKDGPSKRKFKGLKTKKQTAVKARDTEWEDQAKEKCVKGGWLMKKSPSRFKAWQSRYFRLIDGGLYYYKSEKLPLGNFQGRISIDRSCQVMVSKHDPEIMFLVTPFRKYEIKGDNAEIVKDWAKVLEEHHKMLEETKEALEVEAEQESNKINMIQLQELEKKVPDWMVEWDENDPVERLQKIEYSLENKFQDCTSNLDATVAAATTLIEDLDEMSTQCLELHDRPDILTVYVRSYHIRFEREIGDYLSSGKFEVLSIHDMLRLMDLITAYEDFMKKLLDGEPYGKILSEQLPPFSMEGNVRKMGERYLAELEDSLGTWVENITKTNLNRGEACVELISQGSPLLCTSAPVDIFNMINETLMMARQSGVEVVQGAVLQTSLVAIADYIGNFMFQMQRSEKGRMLAKDLRFLCAVTNDCNTVIDHLDGLEKSEYGARSEEYGIDWEPFRVKYEQSALILINMIVQMIRSDLEMGIEKLFTSSHLDVGRDEVEANIVLRMAVTIQDYLEDIYHYLVPIYRRKLVRLLIRDVIVTYCDRMMRMTPIYANPATFVDEILELKTYSVLAEFSPLDSPNRLNIDDTYHIMADRECLINPLRVFVEEDPNKYFEKELGILSNIQELLVVAPECFAGAVVQMCQDQTKPLQRSILATALACLSLRLDVSPAQAGEIRHAISTSLKEVGVMNALRSPSSPKSPSEVNIAELYYALWPRLVINESVSKAAKLLSGKAKDQVLKNHKAGMFPDAKPQSVKTTVNKLHTLKKKLTSPSQHSHKAKSPHRPRGDSMIEVVANDISDEATMARKQHRDEKLDVTEDIRDVDLHGYMDKRGPHHPYPWQRRWFLVHKAFDDHEKGWKMALSWHKSHNAPVKQRIFLEEIEKVEMVTPLPVRMAADGMTLVLMKDQIVKKKSGGAGGGADCRYEFKVVTKERTYTFRTTSMSETITWINGLSKASREAKRMAAECHSPLISAREDGAPKPREDYSQYTDAKLRSLCSSKGHRVHMDTPRETLIEVLEQTAMVESDKYAAAEQADIEEKRKLLNARPLPSLRAECEKLGLDMSLCESKADFVALLLDNADNTVSEDEQKAHLVQLILRGHMLLEEEGNGSETEDGEQMKNIENAIGIFERVAREANILGSSLIEAKAMHGLATAYTYSTSRLDAAPIMLEMAAKMFWACGEKADSKTCTVEASEMYRYAKQYEDAIRCLLEYDTKSRTLEFSERIEQLRNELRHPKPTKKASSRLLSFFSA